MHKYTVYKTTNSVNGKYYIGVHKTTDINDSYLGSGTYIKNAIAKYGVSCFIKEVLAVFDTQQEAWDKETQIIEQCRADRLCTNIRKGGSGGFDYINNSGLAWSKTEEGRNSSRNQIIRLNKVASPHLLELRRSRQKVASAAWVGKKHTEQAKDKVRQAMLTKSNTFKGRRWMYNTTLRISKAVEAPLVESHLSQGWVFGRNRIIKRRGKMWVNDGNFNKMLDEGEVPVGWVRGRIGVFIRPEP